jgi:putative glycosyltransferase
MNLSIVTTVYKSVNYLEEFLDSCLHAIEQLNENNFEIIFVLDGITDSSKEFLLKKKQSIPQIVVVELSRNFGHHYAASAGLKMATGEKIFIIDCDLEVSPVILVQFYHKMSETSADVVYGYQEKRKGKFVERILGGLFWQIFNLLSDIHVPANILTERLMTRKYLDALNTLHDKNLFLGGMMYWVGFYQIGIPVTKKQRHGKSSYSFSKRVNLLIEAISSFSEKPLKLLFKSGLYLTAMAFIYALYLIISKLLNPEMVLIGYTSIMAFILFAMGTIITSIGALGIYMSKIFRQVQGRPLYIINNIYK